LKKLLNKKKQQANFWPQGRAIGGKGELKARKKSPCAHGKAFTGWLPRDAKKKKKKNDGKAPARERPCRSSEPWGEEHDPRATGVSRVWKNKGNRPGGKERLGGANAAVGGKSKPRGSPKCFGAGGRNFLSGNRTIGIISNLGRGKTWSLSMSLLPFRFGDLFPGKTLGLGGFKKGKLNNHLCGGKKDSFPQLFGLGGSPLRALDQKGNRGNNKKENKPHQKKKT